MSSYRRSSGAYARTGFASKWKWRPNKRLIAYVAVIIGAAGIGFLTFLFLAMNKWGKPPVVNAPGPTRVVAVASPSPEGTRCTPGTPVHYRSDTFTVEFLAVEDSRDVFDAVGGKRTVADYGPPLFKGVEMGTVHLFRGGELTLHVRNIHGSLPNELPRLSGHGTCADMAHVQPVPGGFDIDLPNQVGEASIVLPRTVLQKTKAPIVCVTAHYALVYVPELTTGSYKGQHNVICGLPGEERGSTRVGDMVAQGKKWVMYPLIAANPRSAR